MTARSFGYTRSTAHSPDTSADTAALVDAGCEEVFVDIPRHFDQRRQLRNLLSIAAAGDVVVVPRLVSIGRDLSFLMTTLIEFADHGLHFRCLDGDVDTSQGSDVASLYDFARLCAGFNTALADERRRDKLPTARGGGL